jgi:His/Glu/Gln/Arg/opine family amino acid ABC transporter permease subunit
MLSSPHAIDYLRQLGHGALTTLKLGGLTLLLGSMFGAVLGVGRALSSWPIRYAFGLYVEVVRSIPLLVLLFLGYYGIPIVFGITVFTSFEAAVVIISLYQAAYVCEIVRAGLEAVPRGQWEASRALGLGRGDVMARVIAPQALRIILPPFTLQCIGTFKDTSVASIIGVVDLTNTGLIIRANTESNWDVFGVLALTYFVICVSIGALGRAVERRLNRGFGPVAERAAVSDLVSMVR